MAGLQRGAHQPIAGIGDQRHAGVGYQRHPQARREGAQQTWARWRPGWRRCRPRWGGDAVRVGELGEDAGVFGRDQVDRPQGVECSQGDVTRIADRGRDNVEAGPPAAVYARLPIGSLGSFVPVHLKYPSHPESSRPMRRSLLALAIVAFLLGACTEPPKSSTPQPPPKPYRAAGRLADHGLGQGADRLAAATQRP